MSFLSEVIPRSGIRVSFIDNDGKKVSGITVEQANQVAEKYPDKKFYFQNGDGIEKELTIKEVNNLLPSNLVSTISENSTGPLVCGPPLVRFFGGNGVTPSANAIISPISSSVIGFDIINSGFGFTKPPNAEIIDLCGKGSGCKLEVNMEDDEEDTTGEGDGRFLLNNNFTPEDINIGIPNELDSCELPRVVFEKSVNNFRNRSKKVKNITIVSPGDGYLSAPDGSLGGNERVWKEPDEGYVKKKCGGYHIVQPYRPIKVEAGDTYYPPNGPSRILEEDEEIILPLVPVIPPEIKSGKLTYSVILLIDEIKVLDGGFGYRKGDKLIINPDNGTLAELDINEQGTITKVNVIRSGCGYNDLPSIRTDSKTGFNATFSAILKPIKIDLSQPIENQVQKEISIDKKTNLSIEKRIDPVTNTVVDIYKPYFVPENVELITVIDCVGRIF